MCKSMQEYYECAKVCKSMQEYYECARVCKSTMSVQEYARVCKSMQEYYECAGVCKSISLVPRYGGRGGEKVPGTHCLRMHLIITEFRGNCVCTYTGDVINSLRCCAGCVLFE